MGESKYGMTLHDLDVGVQVWIKIVPGDEGVIYLAGKDAEYHILRISINGFTKVLEGLRVDDSGKKQDFYLDFCSCFLVNLWLLVFHGSREYNTGVASNSPCTRPGKQTRASYFVAVYGFRGEALTLIFNGYLG